ncbi:MAG: hypothetical protein SGILL_009902 [Bacillariaceae sp.]
MKFMATSVLSFLAAAFCLPRGAWSQALTEPDSNCAAYLEEVLDCIDSDTTKNCAPLPVPPQSIGPMIDPSKGYYIENPRDGVYGVTDGTYWFMVFVGSSSGMEGRGLRGLSASSSSSSSSSSSGDLPTLAVRVAIFDFPQRVNISNALDEILMENEGLDVDDIDEIMMLYSHDHLDHIGGAGPVREHILATYNQESVEIVASQGTHDLIQEQLEEGRWLTEKAPPSTRGFADKMALKLSDDMILELETVSAHTEGRDVVLFLPRGNDEEVSILMAVDMAYAGWAPFYSVAIASDYIGYQRVMGKFLNDYDFVEGDYFSGGHLTKTGTRSDLELFKRLVDAAFAAAGKGLATANAGPILMENDFFTPGSRTFGNSWYATDVSIGLATRSCLKDLVSEFGCLLAGLDIMGFSMCQSLVIYYITET